MAHRPSPEKETTRARHREEMARRRGERAARVFGFAPSIRPKAGEPPSRFVQRLFGERVRDLQRCAALRAIRARSVNFRENRSDDMASVRMVRAVFFARVLRGRVYLDGKRRGR